MRIFKCALGYMFLRLHIPLILIIESLLLTWQLILQLNLTRRWFQTIFIIEIRLNFGTKGQSKLKLLLGLLIIDNLFTCLDTVHPDIFFHDCVQFWKMSNHLGYYEIVFLRSLEKFHDMICTVRYQTHMSVCVGSWMVLHKFLHPLSDLWFFTISWWIGTLFTYRVGFPKV